MENKELINPKTKEVLEFVGMGVFLLGSIVFPGLPIVANEIEKTYRELKREKDLKEWKKFNTKRLRFVLKRLAEQKDIKIDKENGFSVVKITNKGRIKLLKYQLEEMAIKKQRKWDGKWRLVIYDIAKFKKGNQEIFRRLLKRLKMLQLQKSVYLYPYPCEKEIDFLREYFNIGESVMFLTVSKLENESVFKEYFDL